MAVQTTINEKDVNHQHVEKVDSDASKGSSSENIDKVQVTEIKNSTPHRDEKRGGLRIDGDDLDHEHEPKVN